jgi:hypothetical protein
MEALQEQSGNQSGSVYGEVQNPFEMVNNA